MLNRARSTMGLRVATVLAFFFLAAERHPVAAQQELPDSVVLLEPIVVRVLQSSMGMGMPFPVSVVTGKELWRGHSGAFLEEALRALPGVQIQNRFNLASAERLAVRGFGSGTPFGIRSVRVLVDGIPATFPDGQTALDHLDPGALGRVEILRGPGAAIYGNAAGGVLHFESPPPDTGDIQLVAHTSGGSDGLRKIGGSASGMRGRARYRIGFSRFTYQGFRKDPVADDGSTYGEAKRFIVNGRLQVPVGSGQLRVVVNGLNMDAGNPGSLSSALLADGDRQAYRFNVIQRTREEIRQGQLGAVWTWPVGALRGEAAAWGIHRDFLGAIPPAVIQFNRAAGGLRVVLRGSRPAVRGTASIVGGVELELQREDRRNWANEAGERGALSLDQEERVHGAGLFVQGRLDFAERMSVVAALRYDRIRFRAEDGYRADGTDDSGQRVMDAASPSLGLVLKPGSGVELFASAASSFETPTTRELANRPSGAGGFNPTLEPVRGRTIEGGVRARGGDLWRFEATFFRTHLDDELVPFEVPGVPGRAFFRNAGTSRHRGWEVAVDGRPAQGATLRLAWTHVDGRFEEFQTAEHDYSGKRVPGLAPHHVDGRILWEWGGGYFELRGLYLDAIPTDDANQHQSGAYFLVDTRFGIDALSAGALDLSPFIAVANVLDRRYNASVVVNAAGLRFFEPGPGRTFQAGLRVIWPQRAR